MPPPAPPPLRALHALTTRRLLYLHGPDSAKFLQGTTTNLIPQSPPYLQHGQLSLFLTGQGRVLYDAFIYPIVPNSALFKSGALGSKVKPDDPGFVLEVDSEFASDVLRHVKRYKLRAKFEMGILEESQWGAYSYWGTDKGAPESWIGMEDNRAPGFGWRAVAPAGEDVKGVLEVDETVGTEEYKLRRYLNGIPEGKGEIISGTALPLESNFDIMGGVHFKKGCYVGQELTVRTKHTGVVRKRILPVRFYPESEQPQETDTLEYKPEINPDITSEVAISRLGKKTRDPGRVFGSVGNVGLGLCRLEALTGEGIEQDFKVEWETDGQNKTYRIKAFTPSWHKERLES
ncbi:Aminomethyltransferase folate-binding domain-containing protein [Ascobolus immersus RN42]|uniref:Iron-sulfur cluster assembly factor IBA57 homolog, mitochondrial n=1 Tax=Ascobolus immersus RN42 TaxID=1160509 RepID=A0A3N4HZ73_ASCIM|nr:Aminomethyltransferase folate-binding domain-containing protein [Ascobolus immersus RN42]